MSDTRTKANEPLVVDSIEGVSTFNVYVDNANRIGVVEFIGDEGSEPIRRGLLPEQLVELGIGLLTAANYFRDGESEQEPKKTVYDS